MGKGIFYFILSLLSFSLLAQTDGSLDPSFGNGGKTAFAMGLAKPAATSNTKLINTGKDGSVTLFGTAYINKSTTYCLARLLPSGQPDSGFGDGGKIYLSALQVPENSLVAFRTDSLNRVIIGCTIGPSNTSIISLYRFHSNGLPDSTFGNNGVVNLQQGIYSNKLAGMELLPNGKIFLCGTVNNGNNTDFLTRRLTANGQLDSTFNGTGTLISTFSTGLSNETVVAMYVQSDGKYLVGGNFFNGLDDDFALLRLTESGIPDTSFGTGGKLVIDYSGYQNKVLTLAEGPQLSILILALVNSNSKFAVKLLTNGQADLSFGINGRFLVSNNSNGALIAPYGPDRILVSLYNGLERFQNNGSLNGSYTTLSTIGLNQFGITDSGKVFCAGTVTLSAIKKSMVVLRLSPDFTVDQSFGTGIQLVQLSPEYYLPISSAKLGAFAVDPINQSIYFGGSGINQGTNQMVISRLLPNGNLDTTFGHNGLLMLEEGLVQSIYVQNDHSILVAGYVRINLQNTACLFKLLPNGDFDTTFGGTGKVFHTQSYFRTVVVQSDGKIVAGGEHIVRYLANGQYDYSFGVNGVDTNFVYAKKCLIQPNQSILVAGDTMVCRILPNGGLDNGFIPYSKRYWYYFCYIGSAMRNYTFEELFLQGNGNIMVSGYHVFPFDNNCLPQGINLSLDSNGKLISGPKVQTDYTNGVQLLRKRYVFFSNKSNLYYLSKMQENGNPDYSFGIAGKVQSSQNLILGGGPPLLVFPFLSQWQGEGKLLACFFRNDSIFMARHLILQDSLFEFQILPKAFGSGLDTFHFQTQASPLPDSVRWNFSVEPDYLMGTHAQSMNPSVRFPAAPPADYIQASLIGYYRNGRVLRAENPKAIRIGDMPLADFTFNRTVGTTSDTFVFTSTSNNFPVNYEWTFSPNKVIYGYMQSPFLASVRLVFTQPGTYGVGLKVRNSLGSDSLFRSALIQINPTGINENETGRNFQVYPNPSQGDLTILSSHSGNLHMALYSCTGQSLMEQDIESRNGVPLNLKLPELSSGLYYMQFTSGSYRQTLKLILNKD